jgi:hypothetical protein
MHDDVNSDSNSDGKTAGIATPETPENAFFIQPKIAGYRQLTAAEANLMNLGKQLEAQVLGYVEMLQRGAFANSVEEVPDARSLALGRTQIETGFMWIQRAIARPQKVEA